jgi:hypothetical protein
LATYTFAGNGIPQPPPKPTPIALAGTTWGGALTFVDTGGNTETDNATLTFSKTQTGNFLTGTLQCDAGFTCTLMPATEIPFVSIIDGGHVEMTAVGFSMSAAVFMGPAKKGTSPPQSIGIQGSDLGNGGMFQGNLTKKQ